MISSLLQYDTALLIRARGLANESMAPYIQIFGELIIFWCAIFLVSLWLYGVYTKLPLYKHHALRIFFLIIFVFILYGVINFGIPQWRPSPMHVIGGIPPLIPHPIDNSFPSGHALFSAAFLVGIAAYLKNWGVFFFTLCIALVTTISRVIAGVHYPGDILFGFLFGGLGALMMTRMLYASFFEKELFPFILKIASILKL